MSIERGALYVVATPIGNLEDISPRALRILAGVDTVLAEDTRHTRKLLAHYGIGTPMLAYHEHSEHRLAPGLAERIEAGETMALVSDAGTPLISDPGYPLIARLRERGRRVIPVPGPSALVAALSVAGLPTDRFVFEGFLPPGRRRPRLEALAGERRTLVFFEAPHRMAETLADMQAVFGGARPATVARELTKRFESIEGGTLAALGERLAEAGPARGEFVIVVAGAPEPDSSAEPRLADETRRALELLLAELPLKRAVEVAGKLTGERRNRLYELALVIRNS